MSQAAAVAAREGLALALHLMMWAMLAVTVVLGVPVSLAMAVTAFRDPPAADSVPSWPEPAPAGDTVHSPGNEIEQTGLELGEWIYQQAHSE